MLIFCSRSTRRMLHSRAAPAGCAHAEAPHALLTCNESAHCTLLFLAVRPTCILESASEKCQHGKQKTMSEHSCYDLIDMKDCKFASDSDATPSIHKKTAYLRVSRRSMAPSLGELGQVSWEARMKVCHTSNHAEVEVAWTVSSGRCNTTPLLTGWLEYSAPVGLRV